MSEKNTKTAAMVATRKISFVDGLASIKEAILQMQQEQTNFLVVNKRDEHDAYAIITATDIIQKVIVQDLKPSEVSVYEVMNKPVIVIPGNLNARYVPRLMQKCGLRYAPVANGDHLIGAIGPEEILQNAIL
jgi:signal-transduction protein with cAMP-binding, CBS, and nucleotidyltransferase domain